MTTIASEIQRIKSNIANTYTVLEEKGATLPVNLNSNNLASCANSISSGGGGGIQYEGTLNFIPIGNCSIDSNGISTQGGFCLDITPNDASLKTGGLTGILNYLFPDTAYIGVRVRFKLNELDKEQHITGTRTWHSETSNNSLNCMYGVDFFISSDNSTVGVTSGIRTLYGTLLNTADTTSYIDLMIVNYNDGSWKLRLYQSTDLGNNWTALNSAIEGRFGNNSASTQAIGTRLYDISYGQGYIGTNVAKTSTPFNFNGSIDALNSGIYKFSEVVGNTFTKSSICLAYTLCQSSSNLILQHYSSDTNFSIEDGVASNFTQNSFLVANKVFSVQPTQSWERGIKITTGTDITTEQWILGAVTDCVGFGVAIKNGKFLYFGSTGGNIWFINGVGGWNNISPNTTYYTKVTCTYYPDYGTYDFNCYYSTDNENWTTDYGSSGNTNYLFMQPTVIGMHASFNIPFLGSIDLNSLYWKINNVEVFRGII